MSSYKLDWVLNNELGIGSAPKKSEHFDYLKQLNIKSIINLCTEEEAPIPENISDSFQFRRFTLPDHKVKRNILKSEIKEIISIISLFKEDGPVFVHCFASVERSPLICMAWLVVNHNLIKLWSKCESFQKLELENLDTLF